MYKKILLVIFLLSFLQAKSYTVITATGGQWRQNNSWDLNRVPQCGDSIVIPAGITITIQGSHEDFRYCEPGFTPLCIDGTLNFNCGFKITLAAGSFIYLSETGSVTGCGGGGMSNYITIGGTTVWNNTMGTISGPLWWPNDPALPVELVSFSARYFDNRVDIEWTTSSETNNDYFSILRSADGRSFETIQTLKGAGNSNHLINYSIIDEHPLSGISYYRLKQTDFDGEFEYSEIVSVTVPNFNQNNYSFIIYPNPVSQNEDLYMEMHGFDSEKEVLIVLLDILGQEMYSKVIFTNFNGETLIAIDTHSLIPSGTYFIIATSDDRVYKRKLVIY